MTKKEEKFRLQHSHYVEKFVMKSGWTFIDHQVGEKKASKLATRPEARILYNDTKKGPR